MMFDGFYNNKKVFLTGHTGFKGSWLSLWLSGMGAKVMGYSLEPPTEPSLFSLAGAASLMESITGDVRDLGSLEKRLKAFSPDIVIHMAAQSLVRKGYDDPVETYSTNVMGTVNLFEAIRKTGGIGAVINVTSDKCYENREWEWGYRENDRLGGSEPYSNSKACSELVSYAYGKSYFNPGKFDEHGTATASVRAGNVIGGGDFADDRLIPDAVRAVLAGKPVAVRNPGAVRPWQHVLEPLSGYLLLAKKMFLAAPLWDGPWNFGPAPEDAKPVSWVMDNFLPEMGHEPGWKSDAKNHPAETRFLRLDSSKARSQLGWKPKFGIKEALGATAQWYREYASGSADVKALTLDQIRAYEEGGS